MKKRILFAMVAVVVGVPLLVTAWFGLGAIAEDLVLRKIVDLAAVEGIGENTLLSLAALADEDEAPRYVISTARL